MSPHRSTDAAALLALTTPTLGAAGAGMVASATVGPMWPGACCAGAARPVRCAAGDNLAIHAAVAASGPGEVVVVAVDGEPALGYWGEILTVAAQGRGVVGLVIAACVRDVDAITRRRFPVFAQGTALASTSKVGPGAVERPVVLGGVSVAPGDTVVADVDGVVVLPAAAGADIVEAAHAHAAREAEMMEAIGGGGGGGATTIDLLDLGAALTAIDGRPG